MKRNSPSIESAALCSLALCAAVFALPAQAQEDATGQSDPANPATRYLAGPSHSLSGNDEAAIFARVTRFDRHSGEGLLDFSALRLSGTDAGASCCAGPGSLWGDTAGPGNLFTVGYGWRRFRLEGSAFAPAANDERYPKENRRLDFRSGRLTFAATPRLALQLDRSFLSELDQFESNGGVRRISFLAHYTREFSTGQWKTTLAWGRSMKNDAEPVFGYLVESTLRWSGSQAVFGRLEQVGSTELLRYEAVQREWYKLNKLSFGYVRQLGTAPHAKVDVGALLSRYFVPSNRAFTYGGAPFSGMVFVRLQLD
jgi:hypothetical protein